MQFTIPLITFSLLPLLTYGANHDISVGPALTFAPNITTAATGDTLTFHFYAGRHDVVQGAFDTPCQALTSGFYSGFIFPGPEAAPGGEANRTFVVNVTSEDPIWFYCSEIMHCQLGMVGVVNPPSSGNTLASYATGSGATKNSTTPANVSGGEVVALSNATASTSSATPSATGTGAGTGTSAEPTPTQSSSDAAVLGSGKMYLSTFAAVIAVGIFGAGLV